ncbi:MAG: hypothetical protein NVS4B12_19450 [Ktedonobacteraceae bacterium]
MTLLAYHKKLRPRSPMWSNGQRNWLVDMPALLLISPAHSPVIVSWPICKAS